MLSLFSLSSFYRLIVATLTWVDDLERRGLSQQIC